MRLALSLIFTVLLLPGFAGKPISLPRESPAPSAHYSDVNEIRSRIVKSGPHRVEGIWQFQNTGATVAIERMTNHNGLPGAVAYSMTVVRSENRNIRPGTLMGVLSPSGKSDTFDAYIYSSSGRRARLTAPKHFTLTLTEKESRLQFKPVKAKYSLNLWRMLPYMFRYAVRKTDNTGEAPIGCIKIFPTPAVPAEPRYL